MVDEIKIHIRDFRIEDYDVLVSLWEEAGLPYKPGGRDGIENIENQIRQKNSIILIADTDGLSVGSVLATHDSRKGWINRLAVALDYRKQGIAAKLVEEAERRLSDLGIEIFACLIEDWNEDSVNFFKNIGYEQFNGIYYLTKRTHPDV